MRKMSLKEIQNVELNMLIYLDEICKQHNIKYYLASGTLLGAVKYKGFIPWDDDIDIILLRNDYMHLMDVLKQKNDRYKLLSIYNCKDYYYPFAKLVDLNTTLVENARKIKDMGVYIDIVPMDGYVDVDKEIKKMRFIKNLMIRRYKIKNCIRYSFDYMKFENFKIKFKKIKDIVYNIVDFISLPFGYNFWVKLFDKKIIKNIDKCKYIGVKTGSFDKKEVFLKDDIIKQTLYEFEEHLFPSFENYDLYLKSKFGDYKKQPSSSQCKSHHQIEVYFNE